MWSLFIKAIEEEALYAHFKECGEIENVRIIRDNKTGLGKGIGYVMFKTSDSISLALKLNKSEINNRIIRVERCSKKQKKQKKLAKNGVKTTTKNQNKAKSNEKNNDEKNSKKIVKSKKEIIKNKKKLKRINKQKNPLKNIKTNKKSTNKFRI